MKLVIGNMDEVSLRFNMDNGNTYDFKGSKEIKLKTTQGIKTTTFTALLTILSDGTKLSPLFIFKANHSIPEKAKERFKNQALLYTNTNNWCRK